MSVSSVQLARNKSGTRYIRYGSTPRRRVPTDSVNLLSSTISFVETSGQTTILTNTFSWLNESLARIFYYSSLPADWDGPGTVSVASDVQFIANQILGGLQCRRELPAPLITPLGDGGLHLEWQIRDKELLIEISGVVPQIRLVYVDEENHKDVHTFEFEEWVLVQRFISPL
jgi:hypothetical protein